MNKKAKEYNLQPMKDVMINYRIKRQCNIRMKRGTGKQ